MEPEFWLQRWHNSEIGFHQEELNPYLLQFWSVLQLPSGAPVFVPLCGKSLDMVWLHQQGHRIYGVELSERAVKDFFVEQQLMPALSTAGSFTLWQDRNYALYCGDFFDLSAQYIHDIAAVYDRASLIALPVAMRQRYAKHMAALIAPGVKILLITLDYPQGQMNGPPFSVSEQEVRQLYEPAFVVRALLTRDALEDNARFRERGLTRLQERVYLLVRREGE